MSGAWSPPRGERALDAGLETRVGRAMLVRGDVESTGDVRVFGRVEGDVRADGRVMIERRGEVHGAIVGRRVDVAGTLVGPAHAAERIEVRLDAVVVGDLFAPRIVIADGARVDGVVHMDVDGRGGARAGEDDDE